MTCSLNKYYYPISSFIETWWCDPSYVVIFEVLKSYVQVGLISEKQLQNQ